MEFDKCEMIAKCYKTVIFENRILVIRRLRLGLRCEITRIYPFHKFFLCGATGIPAFGRYVTYGFLNKKSVLLTISLRICVRMSQWHKKMIKFLNGRDGTRFRLPMSKQLVGKTEALIEGFWKHSYVQCVNITIW